MQQDSNQRTIIIATLSFIVGFGLAWLIAANKEYTKEPVISDEESSETEEISTTEMNPVRIVVQNQTEGVRVTLEKVTLLNPGWAVIHEQSEGKPGRILGAQLFDKGTVEEGVVDLLRGTLAGNTYYAMLHADNGDRAFDPKEDAPLLDEDGAVIMTEFSVTALQETE